MNVDIPIYSKDSGLQLCWKPGFSIKVSSNNNEIIITANQEGLLSLANYLLNLAQVDVPCGTHIHLNEDNSLEDRA